MNSSLGWTTGRNVERRSLVTPGLCVTCDRHMEWTMGQSFGLAADPKKLKSIAVKRIIERGLWEQGIRKPLKNGMKHHEWKAAHSFRKILRGLELFFLLVQL